MAGVSCLVGRRNAYVIVNDRHPGSSQVPKGCLETEASIRSMLRQFEEIVDTMAMF